MQALAEHLPAVAQKQVGKGGFLVLRPDSGKLASLHMFSHCCIRVARKAEAHMTGMDNGISAIKSCLCTYIWV